MHFIGVFANFLKNGQFLTVPLAYPRFGLPVPHETVLCSTMAVEKYIINHSNNSLGFTQDDKTAEPSRTCPAQF